MKNLTTILKKNLFLIIYLIFSFIVLFFVIYYLHNNRINTYFESIEKDLRASNKIAFLSLKESISKENFSHEEFLFNRDKLQRIVFEWNISFVNMFLFDDKNRQIMLFARNLTQNELEKNINRGYMYHGKYKDFLLSLFENKLSFDNKITIKNIDLFDQNNSSNNSVGYFKIYYVNSETKVLILTTKKLENKCNVYLTTIFQGFGLTLILFSILIPLLFRIFNLRKTNDIKSLKHLYTDDLTSLWNRTKLLKDIKTHTENNPDSKVILIISDIQNFKNINSYFGFLFGNRVLQNIAEYFEFYFKQKFGFKLYRISGDKFAFLKTEHIPKNLEQWTTNIISNYDSFFYHDKETNIEINFDLVFGASTTLTNLLTNAELSLTQAKKSHKILHISTQETNIDITKKIETNAIIHNAINTNNVILFYQPIVRQDGIILKYEALLRIRNDEQILTPFHFLDNLKQTNYYIKVSQIVIKKALETIKYNRKNISINLSYEDLIDDELIKFLSQNLINCNCGSLLTIEIVETDSIESFEKVKTFIQNIRKFGVKIAIDDFGSGYSNYQNIIELKPDYIKIDGSLIKNINNNNYKYSIVKSIISFAKELNINIIAEFVENKEVFELLKNNDIYGYQGYYFHKPNEHIL
jgi:diguanylate cyclase (GGDEF)-like protein